MTAPTTLATISNRQERDIIAGYATGKTVTDLVADGAPKKLTTDLVADVAKFDRGRARKAVLEYDQRTGGAPTPTPAPPARQATPAEPADGEQIDTVTDLLDAAEQTEVPRLVKAAGRIREQIAELQTAVATVAREQKLRAEVDAARVAYERAQAELREMTGKAPGTSAGSGLPTREIRAWAAQNGVECSTHGRVPEAVVEQWRAATGG